MVCLVYLVYLVSLVYPLSLVRPNRQEIFRRPLMRRARWFWPEPGGVLEDALRAGVVDKLLAADQPLLHRHPAPCAEAIGEIS